MSFFPFRLKLLCETSAGASCQADSTGEGWLIFIQEHPDKVQHRWQQQHKFPNITLPTCLTDALEEPPSTTASLDSPGWAYCGLFWRLLTKVLSYVKYRGDFWDTNTCTPKMRRDTSTFHTGQQAATWWKLSVIPDRDYGQRDGLPGKEFYTALVIKHPFNSHFPNYSCCRKRWKHRIRVPFLSLPFGAAMQK